MKGVKRSSIFIACLFFIIICLCLFAFIYFHNNIRYEGFQQSAIINIQQLLWTNPDSMEKYIQQTTTIQNNDKQQLTNILNNVGEAFKTLFSNCNNGNCTNIPRSDIASIQHILFSNPDSMQLYIHLSTTIQNNDKQQLTNILNNVGESLKILFSNCNDSICN